MTSIRQSVQKLCNFLVRVDFIKYLSLTPMISSQKRYSNEVQCNDNEPQLERYVSHIGLPDSTNMLNTNTTIQYITAMHLYNRINPGGTQKFSPTQTWRTSTSENPNFFALNSDFNSFRFICNFVYKVL